METAVALVAHYCL